MKARQRTLLYFPPCPLSSSLHQGCSFNLLEIVPLHLSAVCVWCAKQGSLLCYGECSRLENGQNFAINLMPQAGGQVGPTLYIGTAAYYKSSDAKAMDSILSLLAWHRPSQLCRPELLEQSLLKSMARTLPEQSLMTFLAKY